MEEEGATAFGQQTLKRAILQATSGWFWFRKKRVLAVYFWVYIVNYVTCHMPIYFHVIFHKMY